MNTFELSPSPENILRTFEQNLLKRNDDLAYFIGILNSIESNFSIALDAPWGAGKTFFIKQVKMILDSFNDHITSEYTNKRDQVRNTWNTTIKISEKPDIKPFISAYYDAWINDNDEDPVSSLLYTIIKSIGVDFTYEQSSGGFDILTNIIDIVTGKNISDFFAKLKSPDYLEKIKEQKDLYDQINDFFESLLAEHGDKLVIFIDELDRCNPRFAVKLLERIKHYFCNSHIIFVFSVNISELQHTVKQCYGLNFNASKYLNRFFDLKVTLPPANLENLYYQIGLNNGTWIYENVCKAVIDAYHFEIRDIMQFYNLAKIVAYAPMHNEARNHMFPGGDALRLSLMLIAPIVIGLKLHNQSQYEDFINGKDSSPLHDVIKSNDIAISAFSDLLEENETYHLSQNGHQNLHIVPVEDKLNEVYNALFVYQYTNQNYEKRIGKIKFTAETKSDLLKAISTLSPYASY